MRCRKCDKSQHVHCMKGKCECKCRTYYDNKKAETEEEPVVPSETLDKWNSDLERARSVFGLKTYAEREKEKETNPA